MKNLNELHKNYKIEYCYGDTEVMFTRARNIRKHVFSEEQGFDDAEDHDHIDAVSYHVLALDCETKKDVAVARVFQEQEGVPVFTLGRFAIEKPYRKLGLGRFFYFSIETFCVQKGAKELQLHAQYHAVDFYKKCGFQSKGDIFLEEGAPHIMMVKTV